MHAALTQFPTALLSTASGPIPLLLCRLQAFRVSASNFNWNRVGKTAPSLLIWSVAPQKSTLCCHWWLGAILQQILWLKL